MTTLTQFSAAYHQDPHAVHELLRAEGPAREVYLSHGLKVWIVTRYDEAKSALSDSRLRKNVAGMDELFSKHMAEGSTRRRFDESLAVHMLNSDPPDHTRLRKLVTKAFTARQIERLRPRIEEITNDLLDNMSGEVDLLEVFAFPLPITVICELLGIPVEDQDSFREWTNVLLSYSTQDQVAQASAGIAGYLNQLVENKRQNPGEDFFSALVHADEGGDQLSHVELISMAFLLLIAGHETTVNLIGNATLALLRNPEELKKLQDNPALIGPSAEEFLRFDGPVNLATFRYTAEPVDLGGVTIPEQELVLVSLTGANRDPERFAEPDKLDVTRNAGGHLAFGHGIHYCVGAPLARLEFEVAMKGLLARFPGLSLAAEPEELTWRDSNLIRGLVTLPVRLA